MAENDKTTIRSMTELIEKAGRFNRFCTSGDLPAIDPGLSVEGVGRVKLPLAPKQAKELIAVGRVAPFGKGTQTLVDTKVRNTTELDAGQVQLSEAWNAMIAELVAKVAVDLGLEAKLLEASLYKMLLYERGGHFQWHRDSEKKNRMVASLIVVLPTEFYGGKLFVQHGDQRQSFAFEAAQKCQAPSYVAFYADCEHEVNYVERGRRLCLAYNLVLNKGRKKSQGAEPSSETGRLAESIERYAAQQPTEPLVFALEHLYTQKSIKRDLLKGADRKLADLVISAAEQAGCRTYLAQIQWHVIRAAYDYNDSEGSWDYRKVDISEIEVAEKIAEDVRATEYRDLSGKIQPFGAIPLAPVSIVSTTPLEDWKPTSEEYEGYTGNEGNTLDRWYHRSALIVWRDDEHYDIVARGGAQASIALFDSMLSKLATVPKGRYESESRDCKRLARAILKQWPDRHASYNNYDSGSDKQPWLQEFIEKLAGLGDAELVRDVLAVMTHRDKETKLGKFLSVAAKKSGLESLEHQLVELLSSSMNAARRDIVPREFQWLARLAGKVRQAADVDLLKRLASSAAHRFVEGLGSQQWLRGSQMQTVGECLEHLLECLTVLGCMHEIANVVAAVETHAELFRLHVEQADCLTRVIGWCQKKAVDIPAAIVTWLDRVRAGLETRTRVRPSAPATWARPAVLKCSCQYCVALNQFLNDPQQETTSIAAAERHRQHIASEVRIYQADLSFKLDRRGSPYRLAFTKTTGSYDRALKQFHADVAVLEKLASLLPSA